MNWIVSYDRPSYMSVSDKTFANCLKTLNFALLVKLLSCALTSCLSLKINACIDNAWHNRCLREGLKHTTSFSYCNCSNYHYNHIDGSRIIIGGLSSACISCEFHLRLSNATFFRVTWKLRCANLSSFSTFILHTLQMAIHFYKVRYQLYRGIPMASPMRKAMRDKIRYVIWIT